MRVHRLPLAVGVLATFAGLGLVVTGGPAPSPGPRTLPFAMAVLAGGAIAALSVLVRSAEGPTTEPLPDPGTTANARIPGERVDERLAGVSWREGETRAELADRIERAAVATLVRTEGWTPAEARERLRDGTWTDDERAAALLSDGEDQPSVSDHVRALATGETPFQRRADHAVAELHRRVVDG
ncbi:hypothetical protein SAMN05216559_0443 [Halomicrobium zhouii]|uniref:Uncharacterized protein n=1 Tax=Halomicrobium zhouii TaxID=767519 RepID=A0A1I6KA06_9EURY|nr:hypothetical protein [Halomicrobium zhouii]SFR88083.1 hypothetical protein SAMN05216559_0443 [Halomicrobium zhouii]